MSGEDDDFLRVTFRGGRFDRHVIPVDVLTELAAIQQALLKLASNEFKRRSPERKRRPRGFAQSARLYLRETEHNCFTAVVMRDAAQLHPVLDPESRDLFVVARDQLFDAFASGPASGLDQHTLKALKRIGERLDDGEAIEMRATRDVSASRVDATSRKRIADALHEPVEQMAELEGEVEALDDPSSTFTLRLTDRRTVAIPFVRAERPDVIEALNLRPAVRVRVRGRVAWSNSPSMHATPEPEFELIDHERRGEIDKLRERFAVLEALTNGWYDGEGIAPDAEVLARARETLVRLIADHAEIPRPRTYPTPDGGVQAEWVFDRVAADVCFQPDGAIVCSGIDADTGTSHDGRFELGRGLQSDASPLANWLRSARDLSRLETAR